MGSVSSGEPTTTALPPVALARYSAWSAIVRSSLNPASEAGAQVNPMLTVEPRVPKSRRACSC